LRNEEPRRKQRGILKTTSANFTPQAAGYLPLGNKNKKRTFEDKQKNHYMTMQ
jgi:hypothetical protein